MPRFDLVIFDLDGTLVDSEPIANRVLWEHIVALGAPMSLVDAEARFTGLILSECLAYVTRTYGTKFDDEFVPRLQAATFAAYRDQLRPIAGVPELLDRLALPRCVASSSDPAKIRYSLEVAGLAHHFGDNLFSGHQVARAKPAPDVFWLAAERMGVAPSRCAVVEDSVYGITAGLAAGMTVFAFDPTGHGGLPAGAVPFQAMTDLLSSMVSEH